MLLVLHFYSRRLRYTFPIGGFLVTPPYISPLQLATSSYRSYLYKTVYHNY